MPCGGIWTPEPGSHWLDHECWVCHQKDCELFCDEWDTTLHVRCLGKFLESEEGRCMLLHGHGISIPEREDETGWPGVVLEYQGADEALRDPGDITPRVTLPPPKCQMCGHAYHESPCECGCTAVAITYCTINHPGSPCNVACGY